MDKRLFLSEKAMLRQKIRDKIQKSCAGDRQRVTDAIFLKLLSSNEVKKAQTVFCYVGTDKEIGTDQIIERMLSEGKNVCVPKCYGKGIMKAKKIVTLAQLKKGMYGILEPEDSLETIDCSNIDLCIVPCLACGRDGSRLGQGAGYYDRFLQGGAFYKIALCRHEFLFDHIPVGAHDQMVDLILTEREAVRVHAK